MKKTTIKTVVFTVVLFWMNTIVAQVNMDEIDHRLIDLYGQARVQEMIAEQPQFIDYMNYYVQHGYSIMYDVPARKLPYFKDISTITNTRTGKALTADDINDLNILLLDIERKGDQYLTYKVGDTGTVVIFIAPDNLMAEYQAYKKMEGQR